jgi:positive regulator of sigma E activity
MICDLRVMTDIQEFSFGNVHLLIYFFPEDTFVVCAWCA